MKENLIAMCSIVMMIPTLSGCSEELQNSKDNSSENSFIKEQQTIFSSEGYGTRTSMDANRKFYWTTGDQIWIETSSGTYQSTDSSHLSDDRKTASFYLSASLKEKKYPVYYTGKGASTAKKVTIKMTQTQGEWNNADHIGTSGDCGVAEAEKQSDGRYTFSLNHKASYIVFQPYKPDRITDDWKLIQIEIVDDDSKKLCGTYPFSQDGLDIENSSYAYQFVTLVLGSGGLSLPSITQATADRKSCFAVVQPSGTEVRNLTIRYTIKPTMLVNYTPGGSFTITKKLSKPFSVNGVTIIRHELSAEAFSTDLFYMWDAEKPFFDGVPIENRTLWYGATTPDYPTVGTNRYKNTVDQNATKSCKDMPNANALSWYLLGGDPRWERNVPWYYEENGGAAVYTYGAWLKKWKNIEGKPEGSTITNCETSYWGTDLRGSEIPSGASPSPYVSTTSYTSGGRPSDLSQYFFLPAMGYINMGGTAGGPPIAELQPSWSFCGCYWSSSLENGSHYDAWSLNFSRNQIYLTDYNGVEGYIVAPGWFQ